MSPSLPRIVFDTNALVSAAILPTSVSRRALLGAPAHFQLVQSPDTWWELSEVIQRRKFNRYFPPGGQSEFLFTLAQASEFVEISVKVADCRDPKDNKFLELAIGAGAAVIVSGDGHLREMHPYRGIAILTPAALLAQIASS